MNAEHKTLYDLRLKISEYAFEAQILFQKINEYECNAEIMALSNMGRRICKKIRKKSEMCEIILEKTEDDI